jgi:DUF3103 family protein
VKVWLRSCTRFDAVTLVAVTAVTAVIAVPQLAGGAVAAPSRQVTATEVGNAKTALARSLAVSLADARWADQVRAGMVAGTLDPLVLASRSAGAAAAGFRAAAETANRTIIRAKGLPATTGSILQLRLAGDAAAAGPILVAAEVNDDRAATTVPAFDSTGREHHLDARTAPAVPVIVVGVDERRALAAGVAVIRSELARHGVASGTAEERPHGRFGQAAAGFWTTRVMSVRLNSDEEPWIKGGAEIYSIVSGVGLDDKPQVDIVQMPYLDYDGTTYYPGQILVNWSHFKWNAVDAVMMEEDDGTNYRALAQALASALLAVLGGVQYAPMVDAILAAMPDSWWTDDPDYVDSWYLLTTQTNQRRNGARANGVITFEPYWVSPV